MQANGADDTHVFNPIAEVFGLWQYSFSPEYLIVRKNTNKGDGNEEDLYSDFDNADEHQRKAVGYWCKLFRCDSLWW